jgi:hypothetical protein
MTPGSTVVIPKSTAHQTITCAGALAQCYRQVPGAGAAKVVGELAAASLAEDGKDLVRCLHASGDNTVRVPVATLTRIAGHLTDGAQAQVGSEALQAALWRTAGRLQRWLAEAAAELASPRTAAPTRR